MGAFFIRSLLDEPRSNGLHYRTSTKLSQGRVAMSNVMGSHLCWVLPYLRMNSQEAWC